MTDQYAGGPPVDPAYTAFSSGLGTAVAEPGKPWRWDPKNKKWYAYEATKWLFEEAGLGSTPAGSALRSSYDSNGTLMYELGASLSVAQLFKSLAEKASEISSKHPKLYAVWSPLEEGAWRAAHQRGVAPGPGPGPGPGAKPVIPQSALDRIARVRAFEAADKITHDAAEEIVNGIVAEYT